MRWVLQMSLKRKIQKAKKKKAEKELKDKVMSFDRMPDCCVMCYKVFDKKSKEDHDTWKIVERREEKRVSLFCPDCWDNGIAAVKESIYKKPSAVDKYFDDKVSPEDFKQKASPKKVPSVEDYVVASTPSVETEDE